MKEGRANGKTRRDGKEEKKGMGGMDYLLFCLMGGSLPPFLLGVLMAFSLLLLLLIRSLFCLSFLISYGLFLRGPAGLEYPFPPPLLVLALPVLSRDISTAEPWGWRKKGGGDRVKGGRRRQRERRGRRMRKQVGKES